MYNENTKYFMFGENGISIGDISIMVFSEHFQDISQVCVSILKTSQLIVEKALHSIELSETDIHHPISKKDSSIQEIQTSIESIKKKCGTDTVATVWKLLRIEFYATQIVLLSTDNRSILEYNATTKKELGIEPEDHLITCLNDTFDNLNDVVSSLNYVAENGKNVISLIWGLYGFDKYEIGNNAIDRVQYIGNTPLENISKIEDSELVNSALFFRSMRDNSSIQLRISITQIDGKKEVQNTYECKTFYDYLYLDIMKMLELGIDIVECQNCGKPFIPVSRIDEKYCDRFNKITGKTCKEEGPIRVYKSKINKCDYLKEKDRTYSSTYSSIVKKHKYSKRVSDNAKADLKKWTTEAKNKISYIEASPEAIKDQLISNFTSWLSESSQALKEKYSRKRK